LLFVDEMLLHNGLLILGIVCGLALAISLGETAVGSTFTIEQIPVKRTTPWSCARSVRRAHLKYGLKVPAEIEEAADRDTPPNQTSVLAKSVRTDQMYVLSVQVGKNNMSLDLDTGSSDLWVDILLPYPCWMCS
jgi:aspergillopepsin I